MSHSKCPYRQGEEAYYCLLAIKGNPLKNDAIELKLNLMGEGWTSEARDAFYAGVRWAEKCHGVTG